MNTLSKATEQLVAAKREFLPVAAKSLTEAIKGDNPKRLENVIGTLMIAAPEIKVTDLLRAVVCEMTKDDHE
ncbi:hypothetical protein [Pseudoalteromonas nigrifaciens]|uniref:hypothetical protein n=1 Tax=Pseudoalteromonas nigrifaciens TaxID=28109 RepID=UPI003FCFBD2F